MNEQNSDRPVHAPKNHASAKVLTRVLKDAELASIFSVDIFFKKASLADKVIKELGLELKNFESETKVLKRQDEKGDEQEGDEQELTLMKLRVPIDVMRKLDEIRTAKLTRMGGKPGDVREGHVDTGSSEIGEEGGLPNAVLHGIVTNALLEGYTLSTIVREIRPARYTRSDVKKAAEALNELLDALELTRNEYEELSDEEFEKLDSKATDKIEWLKTVTVGDFKKTEAGAQVWAYKIGFTFAKTGYTELSETAKRLAEYLDTHYWQHLHFWDNPDGSQRFSCIPSSGTEVPRIFNRLSYRPGRGFIVKMVANQAHKKLDEIKEQLKQLRPSLGDQLKGRMIESGTNPATGSSS